MDAKSLIRTSQSSLNSDTNYLCFGTPLNLNHPDTPLRTWQKGVIFSTFSLNCETAQKMDALIHQWLFFHLLSHPQVFKEITCEKLLFQLELWTTPVPSVALDY